MSHITHFYHLAALDYLDVTTATAGIGGPSVVMSPWAPQHLNHDSIGDATDALNPGAINPVRDTLVGHYVQALQIRREAHIAAAEIDGKHPCQNAQVPGGITTKPSTVNWANILTLMTSIRTFINTKYIPDVLAAALCFGTPGLCNSASVAATWPLPSRNTLADNLFLQGYGCGNLLAWGAFPQPAAGGTGLFSGATVSIGPAPNGGILAGPTAIDETLIAEDTTSSFYSSPSGLHPSAGKTTPDMTGAGKYTWHKAPRYNFRPHEVGPLARMVMNWAVNPTKVSDDDIPSIPGDTLTLLGAGPYIPSFGPLIAYDCNTLVNAVLTAIQTAIVGLPGGAYPGPVPDPSLLMSILGRHAARALECKYLADALACHAVVPGAVPGPTAPGCTLGIPVINTVILDPNPNSEVYTYQVMPKSLKMGRGLTEAPRGALGHWITTENRRISNYQAVVPSTWNACGRDALAQPGPIEQSMTGLKTGFVGDVAGTTADEMINRLLRAIHPFDICVACSVHVTDPKGDTITKFRMDPDGKVTKEEVATEA